MKEIKEIKESAVLILRVVDNPKRIWSKLRDAKSLMAANNAISLLLGNPSAFIKTFSLLANVVNSS